MVIGSDDAELGYPLKFLTTFYRQRDLTLEVFEIFACQKLAYFYFDLDLHFQGHLLQELDGQTHCDHFGENLMKFD